MYLRLRWARFFTLAGFRWKLAARPEFDFRVSLPCQHSECEGWHSLLVRVSEGNFYELRDRYLALFPNCYEGPHPAVFGEGTRRTHWAMVCGHGGGEFSLTSRLGGMQELWERSAHE
jgi:hypothetical protein